MVTVCSMSAVIVSTSCTIPYSESIGQYLSAAKRDDIGKEANGCKVTLLTAGSGSENYYGEVIEIDLDILEPHTDDSVNPESRPITSSLTAEGGCPKSAWPVKISHAMVRSCTNSS